MFLKFMSFVPSPYVFQHNTINTGPGKKPFQTALSEKTFILFLLFSGKILTVFTNFQTDMVFDLLVKNDGSGFI
jgi:hypothetical protein